MADVACSNKVIARNGIGQFRRDVEGAATATVRKAVQRGAKLSRQMAPVGPKHDRRTVPLAQSIKWEVTGRTSGHWFATARHALAQELGAAPHLIAGQPVFKFWWENEGRMWIPGLFGEPDIINHPGNPAQPYLRPAYELVMGSIMEIARQEYPG
jgi:hypothetical protein